jgi:hypothetical protein
MRDQWYGDNRDLVKWGVLLELVRRHRVRHVLQILYYRSNTWGQMEIDGEQVELPAAVTQHFRNTKSVSAIQCSVPVDVVSEPFENRSHYLQIVLQRIQSRVHSPGIVFLDPDTGLEPPGVPGLQHVLDHEARKIWEVLSPGDVMVFYQHQTNRNGTPWIEPKKTQFERALGVQEGSAKLAYALGIARDVAFFFMIKKKKM